MIIISEQLATRQEHKKKDMKLALVMSGSLKLSIKKNQKECILKSFDTVNKRNIKDYWTLYGRKTFSDH